MELKRFLLAATLIIWVCIELGDAITVKYDVSKAPDLEDFALKAKKHMEAWFGYISYILRSPNYTPRQSMTIYFDPKYNGVAYALAGEGKIVGSVNYYRKTKSQKDVGSMIHEMVHVIQRYNGAPSWVTEGIADYVRYYEYNWEGEQRPSKPNRSKSYKDGYGVTAYFLNYVKNNVRKDMIYWVNKDAREGTYKDNIWSRLTGKTLDQLWQDMLKSG